MGSYELQKTVAIEKYLTDTASIQRYPVSVNNNNRHIPVTYYPTQIFGDICTPVPALESLIGISIEGVYAPFTSHTNLEFKALTEDEQENRIVKAFEVFDTLKSKITTITKQRQNILGPLYIPYASDYDIPAMLDNSNVSGIKKVDYTWTKIVAAHRLVLITLFYFDE